MRTKKSFIVNLSFLLVFCMLSGTCGALAAGFGETADVEISFLMLTNPGNAYMIKITLEYNPEVLELVPNGIFDRDVCLVKFNENLIAAFRIRENVRPGSYPVNVRVIEAVDKKGNPVQFPTYSDAGVVVERPPVEVPVYYYDAATGELVKTQTFTLAAGQTETIKAEAPEGYAVTGGQSVQVTVSEDGEAMPLVVTFWLTLPTSIPAPTSTPAPIPSSTPTPTPLPEISLEVVPEVGRNVLSWNPVSGTEFYQIYRSMAFNGRYGPIATTLVTSYTDRTVEGGSTYYYMVEAVFPDGQTVSAKKSAVAATPLPRTTATPSPVKAGECITFGHYETDNNTENGEEPIEWLVLEVREGQALLISKYGLDVQPYYPSFENVTWRTCSLREWLNETFLNSAFSGAEQEAIVSKTVDNSTEQGYWTTGGGVNTEDKVFLLSYAEAWSYFDSDRDRQCPVTEYAEALGASIESDGKCRWWLRSPGVNRSYAAYVSSDGSLRNDIVNSDGICVRPALWVDLGSILNY